MRLIAFGASPTVEVTVVTTETDANETTNKPAGVLAASSITSTVSLFSLLLVFVGTVSRS